MKALGTVLAGLPGDFAVPVVVAQHRRPTLSGDDPLAQILSRASSLPIRVAEPGRRRTNRASPSCPPEGRQRSMRTAPGCSPRKRPRPASGTPS
ncbi:chemotaxis protein CheB [Mycobacterium intracellulare]|uniref:chemotaxis protein CheB n=1 Tax=Mycobacterium intracellulare TaxID=1767 RepID=UPI0022775417|nr:chemotaxis protein CheB [Mycobacterium intracellulare]